MLTAAHCGHNKFSTRMKTRLMKFIFGSHNISSTRALIRTVSAFIIHPDWKPNSRNYDADIAIGTIASPIGFTNFIQPACIFPSRKDNTDIFNEHSTVVGWGFNENGTTSTEDPKSLDILIKSDVECLRSHEVYQQITSARTFCAGNSDGSGPCNGKYK